MAIGNDLKFALRSLRRDWLVNVAAVLSLAVALAGNTTVFSLVNGVLYRPLPYPEPDRIVMLGERQAGAPQTLTAAPANFADWRERNRSFGQLAAFAPGAVAIGRDDRPVTVAGARVSPAFFSLLGAPVLRGRAFVQAEGEVGRDDVVMVTDEFLAVHMPGLDEPVGAEVFAAGRTRTIVGVLPGDFEFFFPDIQVWLPFTLEPGALSRDQRSLFVLGRLRPGIGMEQARQDMQRVWDDLVLAYPESNAGYVIDVLNFRHEIPNDQARALFALVQGAVLFVLLIACANIANLMSARGHRRRREIALRVILGAGRGDIVRQLMIESGVLAVVAGGLGLLAAWGGVRAIGSYMSVAVMQPFLPAIDARVVAFSLAATVAAAVLFGLVPALQSLRIDLAGAVKEGGRGVGAGVRRKMLSRALVVAEIAMSLVLLAGAGIMVQGFLGLRNADPGFDDRNLLTATVTLPVEAPRERLDLMEEIRQRALAEPGVVDATFTTALPMNALASSAPFTVAGRPVPEGEARPSAFSAAVDPAYLTAMRMPLIRGRFFEARDREDSVPVVVVNQALVRAHFPDGEAIGQRLGFGDRDREIIGVVGDTRQSIIGSNLAAPGADPAIFLPLAQEAPASSYLVVRTAGEPGAIAAPLRRRVESLHARLAVGPMETLEDLVDRQWVGIDVLNGALRAFGWLALLLAAIGTYGVLAYNVAQRAREIGVRIAVGARQGQVVRLIVRQGAWLGVLGLAVGAPVVFLIVRVLRYALQGMGTVETGSAFVVAAVLLATTILASLFPALRAARVEPVEVLRAD